jgi:hypothetical protein
MHQRASLSLPAGGSPVGLPLLSQDRVPPLLMGVTWMAILPLAFLQTQDKQHLRGGQAAKIGVNLKAQACKARRNGRVVGGGGNIISA